MFKALKKFYYKHFVKYKFIQSVIIIPIKRNGKKYLVISRCGENGLIKRQNYLIEHLVDENFEVTDQTLEDEKKWFITLPLSN